MTRAALRALLASAVALLACAPAGAQSIGDRVDGVRDGTALLAFPVKDGVCGNGAGMIRTDHGDRVRFSGRDAYRERRCEPGPGRLIAEVRGGRVAELTLRVGGASWSEVRGAGDLAGATDLGEVDPGAVAAWLLDLARESDGEAGEEAVFAATLARGVEPWADLLAIARDGGVRTDTREDATFWLAHAAGERVAGDLEDLADDGDVEIEVREAAVFALSELDDEERAVASLVRVYEESDDPRLRKRALFWLGESGHPRALALFESILLER